MYAAIVTAVLGGLAGFALHDTVKASTENILVPSYKASLSPWIELSSANDLVFSSFQTTPFSKYFSATQTPTPSDDTQSGIPQTATVSFNTSSILWGSQTGSLKKPLKRRSDSRYYDTQLGEKAGAIAAVGAASIVISILAWRAGTDAGLRCFLLISFLLVYLERRCVEAV